MMDNRESYDGELLPNQEISDNSIDIFFEEDHKGVNGSLSMVERIKLNARPKEGESTEYSAQDQEQDAQVLRELLVRLQELHKSFGEITPGKNLPQKEDEYLEILKSIMEIFYKLESRQIESLSEEYLDALMDIFTFLFKQKNTRGFDAYRQDMLKDLYDIALTQDIKTLKTALMELRNPEFNTIKGMVKRRASMVLGTNTKSRNKEE